MTTTDQIENSTNPKMSSNSYKINYGPDTFRIKHKSPYNFYQQWINQSIQSKNNSQINNKEDLFESKAMNRSIRRSWTPCMPRDSISASRRTAHVLCPRGSTGSLVLPKSSAFSIRQ